MRSRLLLVVAAAAFLSLVPAQAFAQIFTLTASLSGEGEATQIANGINTGAFGEATIVIDMTARTVNYNVRVFNLPSGVITCSIADQCRRCCSLVATRTSVATGTIHTSTRVSRRAGHATRLYSVVKISHSTPIGATARY